MNLSIKPIDPDRLAEYSSVPSVITVESVLEIDGADRCGYTLSERRIVAPYTKDYDAYGQGRPLDWPHGFDVSQWAFWIATDSETVVGGAAVAPGGTHMPSDRSDRAVLWDIRVLASHRRRGIGQLLWEEAVAWMESNGYRLLTIETQNVNVAACRFYAKMGCVLDRVDSTAYSNCPGLEDEVMLVWKLRIGN